MVGDEPSGTPVDVVHSTCITDNSPSFPRATHVSSMGAMHTSLLIDNNELMPLRCLKLPSTFKLLLFIL